MHNGSEHDRGHGEDDDTDHYFDDVDLIINFMVLFNILLINDYLDEAKH